MMYMVKPGFAKNIESFVQQGGSFVATYFSGIVDETDLAFENGYPGPLSEVLGIWVEEFDALFDDQKNSIVMPDGRQYECDHMADVLHTQGAKVLATYGTDFYAGMPVVTKNRYGKGHAYYIASNPETRFLDDFYADLRAQHGIESRWKVPENVEVTARYKGGKALVFILNHNNYAVNVDLGDEEYEDLLNGHTISGTFLLPAVDVRVLRTNEGALSNKFGYPNSSE